MSNKRLKLEEKADFVIERNPAYKRLLSREEYGKLMYDITPLIPELIDIVTGYISIDSRSLEFAKCLVPMFSSRCILFIDRGFVLTQPEPSSFTYEIWNFNTRICVFAEVLPDLYHYKMRAFLVDEKRDKFALVYATSPPGVKIRQLSTGRFLHDGQGRATNNIQDCRSQWWPMDRDRLAILDAFTDEIRYTFWLPDGYKTDVYLFSDKIFYKVISGEGVFYVTCFFDPTRGTIRSRSEPNAIFVDASEMLFRERKKSIRSDSWDFYTYNTDSHEPQSCYRSVDNFVSESRVSQTCFIARMSNLGVLAGSTYIVYYDAFTSQDVISCTFPATGRYHLLEVLSDGFVRMLDKVTSDECIVKLLV